MRPQTVLGMLDQSPGHGKDACQRRQSHVVIGAHALKKEAARIHPQGRGRGGDHDAKGGDANNRTRVARVIKDSRFHGWKPAKTRGRGGIHGRTRPRNGFASFRDLAGRGGRNSIHQPGWNQLLGQMQEATAREDGHFGSYMATSSLRAHHDWKDLAKRITTRQGMPPVQDNDPVRPPPRTAPGPLMAGPCPAPCWPCAG